LASYERKRHVVPTRTVIPAQPGWYVAMLVLGCHDNANESDNWDDYLALHPIVAWKIERLRSVLRVECTRCGRRGVTG
jgi:hypothetical protein